ncbi:PKD domain-containing protein, partial [Klebsiella pneumoniae]|nr:PKD domain-containing protein [Klebsiella pneumoniae]
PDGRITRLQWDFGDGTQGEGTNPKHRYASPGTYSVKLTATDDTGSSCKATVASTLVTVNASPVADPGSLQEAFVGGAADAALLDGSASSDPD